MLTRNQYLNRIAGTVLGRTYAGLPGNECLRLIAQSATGITINGGTQCDNELWRRIASAKIGIVIKTNEPVREYMRRIVSNKMGRDIQTCSEQQYLRLMDENGI